MSSDLKISQMTYSGARPTNAGIPWVGGVPTDNFRGNLLDLTGVYANFTAGDRALAGVPTASWPVAGGVYFVVNGGAIYPYLARAGTDAQNVPNIIRPTDYAAGTNEVVYDLLTFYTDGVIVGNGSLTDSTPGLVIAAGGAGNRNIFLNPTGIAGNVTIGNNGVLVLDSGAAQATFTAAGAATWTGAATLTPGAGLDLNVALSGSGKASITNSSGPSLYLNNSGTTATVSHMLYSSATSYGQLAYSPAGGANDGLILNDGRTDAQAKVMVKLQSSEMARFVAGNLLIGTTTNFGGPGNLILGGGAITAAGTNNLTLTGGSSGASLVLGQGTSGKGVFTGGSATGMILDLVRTIGTAGANASFAQINAYNGSATRASIIDFTGNSAADSGQIDFWTKATTASIAQVGRLTTTGNLLIGTTTDMSGVAGGVKIAATNASTNSTSGALQVAGGIYAGAASVFGSTAKINGTGSADSPLHVYESAAAWTGNGITVEQAGAGDAAIQFLLTGVQRWSAGIDNSDSDSFVIGTGALGSANVLKLATTGAATFAGTTLTLAPSAAEATITSKGRATGTNQLATTSRGGSLVLANLDTTDNNAEAVSFHNSNDLAVASIVAQNVSHAGRTGKLYFNVSNGSSPIEAFSIASTGAATFAGAINAGSDISILGTAATDRTLTIQSLGAQYAQLKMNTNSSPANNFQILTESGGRVYFQQNNGAINTLQIESTGNATYSKRWNISDTTSATSSTSGALTIGNGTAATNVAIGGGNINAGGTLTTGSNILVTGATAAPFLHISGANANASPILYLTSGLGGGSQQQWSLDTNNTNNGEFTIRDNTASSGRVTIAKTTGNVSFASTTASTSTTTGSAVFGGGIGVAGAINAGGQLNVQNALALFGTTDGTTYIRVDSLNFGYSSNSAFDGYINYSGYQGGATQFRNLVIGDGRNASVATFNGSAKTLALAGTSPSTGVGTGALQVAGGIYAGAASVFGGGITVQGTGIHSIAGRILLAGGANLTAQGQFGYEASSGLAVWAKTGSTYDYSIYTAAGGNLFRNATGTANLEFGGAATFAGSVTAASLATTQTAAAAVAVASTHKVPIVLNGTTYYLLLTNVP